jgi:threonylcarbamoyladenosine tRNA methylthiotransferase MtaB
MKVLLRTWGCRANQYDTEAVRAMLADIGAEETDDARDADYAVFNSCTVTAAAEADLRAGVRAAARENPALKSIIMGCAPGISARDERLAPLLTLPTVEAAVAGADLTEIASRIGRPFVAARTRTLSQTSARAQLRIQDGCDEHCTFCATTMARGGNVSRRADELVDEARVLAERHPEIVITGIHIGTWGRDIGSSLGELVERLIGDVPGVRFRLTSLEATEVDDRLLGAFQKLSSRLMPHLHAPLQSGSNAVLKRMGRHWYTAESYEARVNALAGDAAAFALSADVIAGFPGESEADHLATMRMVERLPFTALHVFQWSPRPGTAATRLGGRVPERIARRRARELRALGREKAEAYGATRVNGLCDVVVTERGKGLTEDYLSVAISDRTIPRRSRFAATLRMNAGVLTADPNA